MVVFFFFVNASGNERLDEINAEETQKVDERSDKGKNGGEFREGEDVKRDGVANLVTPAMKKIVSNGEEESEENAVC